jgi:DNA-binding CsgD family transcriptional regulator
MVNATFGILDQAILITFGKTGTSFVLQVAPPGNEARGGKQRSVDETLKAKALVRRLAPAELEALRILASGGSVRDLAACLSTDRANAAAIVKAMKLKLGAAQDADAVRLAIYAGLAD